MMRYRMTRTLLRGKKRHDRSRTVHPGSSQRGAGTKAPGANGRRQVDAHSGPGTAPLAGKSMAGAHRPGAAARVGSLCGRWEPGYGWNGESHLGGKAHTAGNNSDTV